jgi:fructose-1-phosphate kinase PfkB-like protein
LTGSNAGTQTAALGFAGLTPALAVALTMSLGMELVGLKVNDLNTARRFLGGAGVNTSAMLAFGGLPRCAG